MQLQLAQCISHRSNCDKKKIWEHWEFDHHISVGLAINWYKCSRGKNPLRHRSITSALKIWHAHGTSSQTGVTEEQECNCNWHNAFRMEATAIAQVALVTKWSTSKM